MTSFTKVAMSAGAIVCAIAIGHESGQTKSAAVIPLSAQSAAKLAAQGKTISLKNGCNTCHGADYKGKPNFSPSLRANSKLWKKYNAKTFARVMNTGVTEDGGKVKKPMPIYHLKSADSAALYAYFKSLK